MQITEVRHTALGDFTIVHEVKSHKAWRIPSLPNGKNQAGGRKAHCPKTERDIPRPPSSGLPGSAKYVKALKLRNRLVFLRAYRLRNELEARR
ncbi:hypothetical protein LCGC14_0572920 [marine sediment metagenome]|uniref:Uncharacterized protein n=1 Tax=marine sediment metagenome TaxID=412755 RepID=A0A0F9U520_9ZZZZ